MKIIFLACIVIILVFGCAKQNKPDPETNEDIFLAATTTYEGILTDIINK